MSERILHKGTIARTAIQCICPDTGKTGSFLFTGESHRIQGSRVTPVFPDLAELFIFIKSAWEPIGHDYITKQKLAVVLPESVLYPYKRSIEV